MKRTPIALSLALLLGAVAPAQAAKAATAKPFLWENATVYFLVTDRFQNADKSNDLAYGRKADAAPLRGFMGGDLKGVTEKIKSGYFDSLGIDVLWMTPPVEQAHGSTDEGTGRSYGFHGYWTHDWTAVDANLGTEQDFRDMVEAAHARGIRVLLDVVMNHTEPTAASVPDAWPADWVRLDPPCTFKNTETNVNCTLVKGLPDVLTGSNANVALPGFLVAKWKAEGRYDREVKELDEFFTRTGYPRAPRYYLMKWHADWVRKYGIDGLRADTVKHVEPGVWKELRAVTEAAHDDWKRANPSKVLGDGKFFMLAEVYGYNIAHGRQFDLGGHELVDYYNHGFDSMINFGLVWDAKQDYETLFSKYDAALRGPLAGHSVLNYTASHDDDHPFDPAREKPFETANKLLLAPGAAQIYYGDETARLLNQADAVGDAKLRSFMNWNELARNTARDGYKIADVRAHYSKLGLFRSAHPAVGAGVHEKIADGPYTFKRTYEKNGISDKVVVALDVPAGAKATIKVGGAFADGTRVKDYYSGGSAIVKNGAVTLPVQGGVALIAK
jgi:alpha-amylase